MPNTQALRRRIRSVRSTQQITKAMKMVAAAKLRRAQSRILEARPYAEALAGVLGSVSSRASSSHHPMLVERPERRVTLVVVTGDKGLCGAFNANVQRKAMALLLDKRWETTDVVAVGRKAIEFFRYQGITPVLSSHDMMSSLEPEAAFMFARRLAQRFTSGDADAVYLLGNDFKSVLQQEVVCSRLLPIERAEMPADESGAEYIYEPPPAALLRELLPRYVEFAFLRTLLSSVAAEHAARMTAMDAASKNAAEMIDQLTLTYNRVRQAAITKEIIEIVSGAQALGER